MNNYEPPPFVEQRPATQPAALPSFAELVGTISADVGYNILAPPGPVPILHQRLSHRERAPRPAVPHVEDHHGIFRATQVRPNYRVHRQPLLYEQLLQRQQLRWEQLYQQQLEQRLLWQRQQFRRDQMCQQQLDHQRLWRRQQQREQLLFAQLRYEQGLARELMLLRQQQQAGHQQ